MNLKEAHDALSTCDRNESKKREIIMHKKSVFILLLGLATVLATAAQARQIVADPGRNHESQAVRALSKPVSDDIEALSDEFNDAASLANWQRYYQVEGWPDKMMNIDVNRTRLGHLFIEPTTCGWYRDSNAPFLFKEVDSNFVVETRLRVSGKSSELPQRLFSLAGLFVRTPRKITAACQNSTWTPGDENWLFLTIGVGNRTDRPQLEAKNTIDSMGEPILSDADTGWVELKITRIEQDFRLEHRFPGRTWVEDTCFIRADMPDTLQVGLTAYSDWDSVAACLNRRGAFTCNCSVLTNGHPDLFAYVDYVRFNRPLGTDITTNAARLPDGFELLQNYPNPFAVGNGTFGHPETTIRYRLSKATHVRLEIFDLLGRKIVTLIDQKQPVGDYSVKWNGENIFGQKASSGKYFYRLETDGLVLSRELTLLQ